MQELVPDLNNRNVYFKGKTTKDFFKFKWNKKILILKSNCDIFSRRFKENF